MRDRKAVLGLDTAKLFVLALLALVIISVVVLIALDTVGEVQDDIYGGALTNASTATVVNFSSSAYAAGTSASSEDCALTVTIMTNATSGTIIPSTNYTITGCAIACSSANGCDLFNNSIWNVTGTYTTSSEGKQIVKNASDAMAELFEDAGTWFTLIGVVIIILIIAVVIVVINRFGGGRPSVSDYSGGIDSGSGGGTFFSSFGGTSKTYSNPPSQPNI